MRFNASLKVRPFRLLYLFILGYIAAMCFGAGGVLLVFAATIDIETS